jgi:hypothetical protein
MASYVVAWPALGMAILVFGFAPGAVLRLLLLIYPRGNPRRKELIGELYAVPRVERPFWVAEQFEIAIFEGLRDRFAAWRLRRAPRSVAGRQGDLAGGVHIVIEQPVLQVTFSARRQVDILPAKVLADDIAQGRPPVAGINFAGRRPDA